MSGLVRGWAREPGARDKLVRDYRRLHREQRESLDFDPVYFILRRISEKLGTGAEGAASAALYHSTWYHLGSTLAAWGRSLDRGGGFPVRVEEWMLELPKTPSRRVFNERRMLLANLTALTREVGGDPLAWLSSAVVPGDRAESWRQTMALAQTLPGNGRYFAYKIAELAEKCVGLPLKATDAGHEGSSGPRKGLVLLYGDEVPPVGAQTPAAIAELNAVTESLRESLGEPDVAVVETTLCAFSSLVNGDDYVGRYIDRTLEEVTDPRIGSRLSGDLVRAFFEARRELFPPESLGELVGRTGIDRPRQRVYRDTGRLLSLGEY